MDIIDESGNVWKIRPETYNERDKEIFGDFPRDTERIGVKHWLSCMLPYCPLSATIEKIVLKG